MSDRWEFFQCQMGEATAFIFFDDGISDDIDGLQPRHLVKVRAAIRAPDPRGLPTDAEFAPLSDLEDQLAAFVSAAGGVYVGRITVSGARSFHYYVDVEEDRLTAVLQEFEASTGYDLSYARKLDPERSGYWDELYPTADDRQVIDDLKVLECLEESGDTLEAARRIDHWAHFPDVDSREAFVAWASEHGYAVESRLDPEEDEHAYGVQLSHVACPQLATITHHTIALNRKAAELGGEYDGWETSVESAPTTGAV